jgi:hypothetical protein
MQREYLMCKDLQVIRKVFEEKSQQYRRLNLDGTQDNYNVFHVLIMVTLKVTTF